MCDAFRLEYFIVKVEMSPCRNAAFHLRAALVTGLFLAGSLTLIVSMMSASTVQTHKSTEVCQGVRKVDQVIFFLVDALRPDFVIQPLVDYYSKGVECDGTQSSKEQTYRPGSLKYIEESLRHADHPSMGFIAVGDSPTITFQRLKAIVTGTTPAFLEIGGNLDTAELHMDNLVYQLQKRSILLGDDTWLNLVPHDLESNKTMWKKVSGHSPFNVSDFDSNDAQVIEAVFPILSEETVEKDPDGHAKLIIAHFLGVDHIGHRFNADVPLMDSKLAQIDGHLRNVTDFLRLRQTETRTLVLVFGDHGMTNSGDHGGDSYQETDSFLYAELIDSASRRSDKVNKDRMGELSRERLRQGFDEDLVRLALCPQTSRIATERFGAVHQVDMTASVAALLGVPIPFSNFGRLIPELFALVDPSSNTDALDECNWRQLKTFFDSEGKAPPRGAPWLKEDISVRERSAKLSNHLRRSSNEMQTGGMFIGSVMVLIAGLSTLLNSDVLRCIRGQCLVEVCAMVIFIFRVCVVFANSFIVKEYVEVFCLLQLMLIIGFISRKNSGRALMGLCLTIVLMRVLIPLLYRGRSHITHLADMTCGLQDLIAELAPKVRLVRSGIFLGATAFFCVSETAMQRVWAILLGAVVSYSYQKTLLHHIFPLALFVVSIFIPKGAAQRYMTLVLWISTLCSDNFLASCAIALYGVMLLSIIRETQHFSAITQAVLLHILAWVGFYSQSNQCLLNAIDFNSSLVGLSESSVAWGGVFVIARTFNAFLLPHMAVSVVNKEDRNRTFRVNHLVLSLAIMQASISCFNSYIQKSHLMLFTIFAPKTLFDVVAALLAAVGYILAILLG